MKEALWGARAAAIRDCADRGLTQAQTARELSLSAPTIKRYRDKYSIEFRAEEVRVERLREMAERGLTREDAAKELGIGYFCIGRTAREHGVIFRHASAGVGVDMDRAGAMASMYRAGKTLEEIGALYGVSRERVRQIISKHFGICADDGGQAIQAKIKRESRKAQREAECYRKHGCSTSQLRELRRIGKAMRREGASFSRTPTGAFMSQRRNAINRGIVWNIKLWEWWSIWERSGKWADRGRSADAYVMCRFRDSGAYEIGNVYIATLRHNSTVQPNNPYRSAHPDFLTAIAEKKARARQTRRGCELDGCDGDHYAHGLCQRHYAQERKASRKSEGRAAA